MGRAAFGSPPLCLQELLARLHSQVAARPVEAGVGHVSVGMRGAVVIEIALSVVGARIAVAIHHHKRTTLVAARLTIEVDVRAASLLLDLAANGVLAVGNDVAAPVSRVAATAIPVATYIVAAAIPPTTAIPIVLPPPTVVAAIPVTTAVPGDVAGVAFHAVTRIFYADDSDAIVLIRIAQEILLAAPIHTREAEVARIAGEGLVAL